MSAIRELGDGLAASEHMLHDISGMQHDPGVTTIATEEESRGGSVAGGVGNTAIQHDQEETYPIVKVEGCDHDLSKMTYTARTLLSDPLDNNGIEKLIHHSSGKDFIDIWRECNGGNQPAFGLIYHLAGSQLVNLQEFKKRALKVEPERSKRLVNMIEAYPSEYQKKNISDVRLDNLPYDLLLPIVSEISAKPYPIEKQARPLWKSIACAFKLDMTTIKGLETQAIRAIQRESMTMKFLEIINQRYPCRKVTWLAKSLKDIQRNDLLSDRRVFGKCIEKGCIILPPDKPK